MIKNSRVIRGVTLLEIMLVLAIAAMIIVMSVRYYQSASASQQTNGALEMIQAITATADGIAQGTGTYTSVSTSTVQPMMPNQSMNTPWGGSVTVTGGTTTYSVTVSSTPGNVCSQLKPRLAGNPKYTSVACSTSAAGNLTYTYDSTK